MKTVKLGDVCEFKPAKSLARAKLADDAEISFSPMEQLPISQKHFTPVQTKRLGKVYSNYVYFEDDDVIYAKITPCFENGKMSIARNLTNGVGFGSSEFVPIRCSNQIMPEYLYYYLLQPSFIRHGSKNMRGASGHKRIPDDFTKDLSIALPDIEEQRRVVERLDADFERIDRAIELTENNMRNSRDLQMSMISKYLSSAPEVREGTIDDLSDLTTDYVANGSFASLKENVTYRRTEDYAILLRLLDNSRNFRGPFVYVDEASYNFLKKSSLEPGDIIISNVGARLGTVFRAPNLGKKMTLGPNSILLKSDTFGDYLYVWLRSTAGQDAIRKLVGGAGQPKFNKTDFRKMIVPVPVSEDARRKAVQKILDIEANTNTLSTLYKNKLNGFRALKQSMLTQAFSGSDVE